MTLQLYCAFNYFSSTNLSLRGLETNVIINAAKLDLLKEHFHYYTLGHVWHKKSERKLFSSQREVR